MSAQAESVPATITTANGRWVSLPIPWESAAGTRPSAARLAVISTGLSRSRAPARMASSSGSPRPRRSAMAESTSTPLSEA